MKNSLLILTLAAFAIIPVINAQIHHAEEIERANERIEMNETMPDEGNVVEGDLIDDTDDELAQDYNGENYEEFGSDTNIENYDYGFTEDEFQVIEDEEQYNNGNRYFSFPDRAEQIESPDYYQYPEEQEF